MARGVSLEPLSPRSGFVFQRGGSDLLEEKGVVIGGADGEESDGFMGLEDDKVPILGGFKPF
jgi:hypothetical protein